MTREELDAANAAAVTRHSRAIGDDPRNPPQALLDELAANAERWAHDVTVTIDTADADDLADGLKDRLDDLAAAEAKPAPEPTTVTVKLAEVDPATMKPTEPKPTRPPPPGRRSAAHRVSVPAAARNGDKHRA